MTRPAFRVLAIAGALALAPSLAFAHTGVGATHGFVHGFMHPVTGLDHVLAMVTVGILAWQMGGRAIWLLPASFVTLMAVGGALGMSGFDLPYVETGIALSVVVLGAAVAMGVKAPLAFAMGLVGMFAVFHGHAHGAEMPETAGGLSYGLGFMLATALLHLAGLGLGFAIGRLGETSGQAWVRGAGAAISLAGVALLTGAL
ncbi:MAG: urease accessory protein [Rhizobiales bacterium 24-66-13]|jgi:urease accessory protein|uniref:HupE/UreJ family protein n=1 Tax=Roseixanthobacter finlandensis TaxID=3119922 RepID=UPI000BD13204|nr:MAG: urease accessory protein [Rhizobiales bacterium 35-66-30]OYZ66238.1 MAG: urease accessory protein [Rhizobiales bacterium 24-66-13]OZB01018.1 MAG: urease accessory protein [Rhizobiales bacterium 39-66-18]